MDTILVTGGSGFIGTNLINTLKDEFNIINLDIVAPKIREHDIYWTECDILDKNKIERLFNEYKPKYVIHLAAKADTESQELKDYETNIDGTRNVIAAANSISDTLEKIIITSTQFVYQADGYPESDTTFEPYTVYGESKVINEKDTRKFVSKDICWTIIRPTNIWGPWHWRYPQEFWRVLSKRRYFHPKTKNPIIRSYGFVLTVCDQIESILKCPVDIVNKEVFYVGDSPINLLDWVNAFSLRQIGREITVVPSIFIKILALIGDILVKLGVAFPITSSRYRSMTTSNSAPMEKTFNTLGYPSRTLDESVDLTIEWMMQYHPELITLKKK